MQKVFVRPSSRCSKKDISFKIYLKEAISNSVECNENYQDWIFSQVYYAPRFIHTWPQDDKELAQIHGLLTSNLTVKHQIRQFEQTLDNVFKKEEDNDYMKDIQEYLNETKKLDAEQLCASNCATDYSNVLVYCNSDQLVYCRRQARTGRHADMQAAKHASREVVRQACRQIIKDKRLMSSKDG